MAFADLESGDRVVDAGFDDLVEDAWQDQRVDDVALKLDDLYVHEGSISAPSGVETLDGAVREAHNGDERTEGGVAFCTECGTQHEIGQRFCANCGTQLGGVITRTTAAGTIIPARAPVSGLSITSFVFGLLSLLGAPIVFSIYYGPWLLGAAAIFCGAFAHRKAQTQGWDRGDALASAGIVLGVVSTLIGTVITFVILRSPSL